MFIFVWKPKGTIFRHEVSGFFPGKYIDVAYELSLHCSAVSKIWNQFCEKKSFSPLKTSDGNRSSLSDGDLQLIEVPKRHKPSTTYSEIENILVEVGDLPTGVRGRLPSAENFTYKKIMHVAQERFTIQNMAYTQIFIDYLHSKDPYTLLKFKCQICNGFFLLLQKSVKRKFGFIFVN